MSEAHGKGAARPVQPQAIQNPENPAMDESADAGEFPQRKRFSSIRWACLLGCSRKTIERTIETNNIPYRKVGDLMFVDSDDLWGNLPVIRPADNKKPRGGNRRRKE